MHDHLSRKSSMRGVLGETRTARLGAVLACVLLFGASAANAGTVTATTGGWLTTAMVSGANWSAGLPVNITFKNAAGTVTGTAIAYPGLGGKFSVGLPAGVSSGDTISFSGTEGDGTTVNGAAGGVVADIGGTGTGPEVVDATIVDPGSTLSVASQLLALTGDFTSVETAFDANPASPTYGDLSFTLLSSGFNLGSTSGPLTIALGGDVPFTLNLIPFLDDLASGNFTSTTIPVSIPLSLTVTYAGTPYAATGDVTGVTTTLPGDQADPSTLNISLSSALGPITGTLFTTSQDTIVPEPSPAAPLLAGLALLSLAGLRSARTRYRFTR